MDAPVSIQKFIYAQDVMVKSVAMNIPIVAVGHAIAQIVLSLAQVIHGLAMAVYYAIKERHCEDSDRLINKTIKDYCLASAVAGSLLFLSASINLATVGLLFGASALCKRCKKDDEVTLRSGPQSHSTAQEPKADSDSQKPQDKPAQ
jgi:hypothetical protein